MGTSDSTGGLEGKLDWMPVSGQHLDGTSHVMLTHATGKRPLPKTKQNPLFVVARWNVLASLPRHLTFKA